MLVLAPSLVEGRRGGSGLSRTWQVMVLIFTVVGNHGTKTLSKHYLNIIWALSKHNPSNWWCDQHERWPELSVYIVWPLPRDQAPDIDNVDNVSSVGCLVVWKNLHWQNQMPIWVFGELKFRYFTWVCRLTLSTLQPQIFQLKWSL